MNIEQLVVEFQAGNMGAFDEIYVALESFRRKKIGWMRRQLIQQVTESDIAAIYDDSLLSAVSTFKGEEGTMFTTHISNIINNAISKHTRHEFTSKRATIVTEEGKKQIVPDLNMDQETDDEGQTFADIIADTESVSAFESLEESTILNQLRSYGKQSNRTAINAQLIVHDTLYYAKAEDKYNEMRKVVNKDISDASLRQKLVRAKKDFRDFCNK